MHGIPFTDPRFAMKWGGIALIALGLLITTFTLLADPTRTIERYWTKYCVFLERKLRVLFLRTRGRTIALGQIAAAAAVVFVDLVVGIPFWYAVLGLVAVGPSLHLDRLKQQRVERVEKDLEGLLVSLANALKSTPSIGAAFESLVRVLHGPLREEVDLAVKEMKFGSTLDQALLQMASRIGSRQVDSALSAILIGRQVGGNLPRILETTAGTLREMQRLDDVVKTKTSEGKMQFYVLGGLPVVMVFALNFVMPGFFSPLTKSVAGYIVIAVCGGCWVTAIVLARKVLSVNL